MQYTGEIMKKKNIIGSKFNELTVIKYIKKPDTNKYKDYPGPWVECRCSCGAKVKVPLYALKKNLVKSCGHYKGQIGGETLKRYYKDHDPSNTIYITYNQETKSVSDWSRDTGIPRTTIAYRINQNLPLDQVFKKEES